MIGVAIVRPIWDAKKHRFRSNGCVSCVRMQEELVRKTNRYEYQLNLETGRQERAGFIYKKGDKYLADTTVTAQFHHEILTMEGGVLEEIRAHADAQPELKSKSVDLQQDQAGGHGINGEWDGKIDAHARQMNINFRDQPSQCPFLNALDLGFWPILVTAVRKAHPRTLDAMFSVIEREFKCIPAEKIDAIFEQKTVMCETVVENDGQAPTKEKHTGYRKRRAANGGAPVNKDGS